MLKETFLNSIRNRHPNNFNKYDYSLVPDEFYSKDKIPIGCLVHDKFKQSVDKHLFGRGCPTCKFDKLRDLYKSNKEEFVRKAIEIHGTKYGYDKFDYKRNNIKSIITCPVHGDFLQTPNNHLDGKGCPRCKESFGEKYTAQILDKNNIQYIREYKISGYRYFYDFYLPGYDIYIEYHGRQHYESVDHFGGKKSFNKTVKRDKVKIELIKRSFGLLIVIKHTFKTKEQIEDELLRLFYLIHPNFLIDRELSKQSIIDSNIYLIEDGISYKRK